MEFEETENLDTLLFPMMLLPREIRGIIYNKIPQNDLVPLRRVCQDWRNEIDDLCEFSVQLDDNTLRWERVLELRIKSCKIISFCRPPPQGLGTTILTHPNLIRRLQILTNMISANNFYYLLSDCSPSLRHCSLQINYPLLGSIFPTSFSQFNFEKLTEFELSVSTAPPVFVPMYGVTFHEYRRGVHDILFTQFMQNPMRSLKHLKLELQVLGRDQVSQFTRLTLGFLSAHWQRLETLDLELIQGLHGVPSSEALPLNDSDLETRDFKTLDRLSTLKSLRLVSSTSIGVDLWIRFLENQKCLEFCEVDILPASNSVFRTLIYNNFSSLKILEISDLSVWNAEGEPEPFDFSILASCDLLKKLVLDRNVTSRRMYDCAELVNLHQLPCSLNELALNYFNVLSEDLLELTRSEAGDNLRNLTLTQCGKSGPYGITGSVLEAIISLESIMFIEISILNFSDPEERVKLNRILETYGYGEDHAYFQLSKLTSLIQGLLDMGEAGELLGVHEDE